jgi:hypothetical protein
MLIAGIRRRTSTEEQKGKALQENTNIQMQEKNTTHWYASTKQSRRAIYLHIDSESIFLRIVKHIQERLPEANHRWNG